MLHRIFNSSNVCGAIALVSLICIPGTAEAENFIAVAVLTAVFAVTAYLSIKEEGKIK